MTTNEIQTIARRYACRLARNQEDREDFAQEAILHVLKLLQTQPEAGPSLIAKAIWNRVMECYRKEVKLSTRSAPLDDQQPAPNASLERDIIERAAFEWTLDRIPAHYRDELLWARDNQESGDVAQYSEANGLHYGTFKSRVVRAKAYAKVVLEQAA